MQFLRVGLFFLCYLFLSTSSADAALLYLDPGETEVRPGDTIAVAVRLDTDTDECVNVVDGTITFPDNISPVDISIGRSILPVWVEQPTIDNENNRITFAGGIPNGYCGRIDGDPRLTNVLLEIIFQAPGLQIGMGEADPIAQIDFAPETQVLLNDGAGTPTRLQTIGSDIYVFGQPSGAVVDEWQVRVDDDTTPPNEFTISLESDPSIYAGRYFIVFNTTDKQSGIDQYQVMEEPLEKFDLFNWGAADAPWIRVRSPYQLEDQSLNSTIRVRAIDKAGNQYVATLVPDESLRSASDRDRVVTALYATAASIILVLVVGLFLVWRRRRKVVTDAPIDFDIEHDE